MKKLTILLLLMSKKIISYTWTPDSWMKYPVKQIPEYPDKIELEKVKDEAKKRPPLVFAGEIRKLKEELVKAEEGEAFILQAGPCAETIDFEKMENIRDFFTLMTELSLVLQFGLEKKVIKIGRIGGQFAKPRSQMYEKDNQTLTYRGDIIHDINNRTIDATRIMKAYEYSLSILNSLRSFLRSGELDLDKIQEWKFPESVKNNYIIKNTIRCIKYMINEGLIHVREPELYISHEALLLHYEECTTKQEKNTGLYYNCGAHTVWLGERTRESEGHIEFLSGIENPIGIKVGPTTDINKLCELIQYLNPKNEKGKIMLIFRMGVQNIRQILPEKLEMLKKSNQSFMLLTDPCHGNTLSMKCNNNIKTRKLKDIKKELKDFFEICKEKNMIVSGVHLEITHEPVTECIGNNVTIWTLAENYKSLVDPRLNNVQSMELMFHIIEELMVR